MGKDDEGKEKKKKKESKEGERKEKRGPLKGLETVSKGRREMSWKADRLRR